VVLVTVQSARLGSEKWMKSLLGVQIRRPNNTIQVGQVISRNRQLTSGGFNVRVFKAQAYQQKRVAYFLVHQNYAAIYGTAQGTNESKLIKLVTHV
jgi:hypothetical protein